MAGADPEVFEHPCCSTHVAADLGIRDLPGLHLGVGADERADAPERFRARGRGGHVFVTRGIL